MSLLSMGNALLMAVTVKRQITGLKTNNNELKNMNKDNKKTNGQKKQ